MLWSEREEEEEDEEKRKDEKEGGGEGCGQPMTYLQVQGNRARASKVSVGSAPLGPPRLRDMGNES